MMGTAFVKMHGSGNDFILIDNRDSKIDHSILPDLARRWCNRNFGIGADGLILIENSRIADFKWQFLNADGSYAEMCGNGGRCAVRFASILGIGGKKLTFETEAGIIEAELVSENRVKLQLTPPEDLRLELKVQLGEEVFVCHHVNTGVPHLVVFSSNLDEVDVNSLGRGLREHQMFSPGGVNVNFVQVINDNEIRVRTYERGVEAETYACGTGAVASALIAYNLSMVGQRVRVITSGGENLLVYLEQKDNKVFLEGGAVLVYKGETIELGT